MDKLIENNEAVILSTIKQGSMRGATKKRLKGFEIGFTNDCFKDKDTIGDLISSFTAGIILLKKEDWSEEVKRYMKK